MKLRYSIALWALTPFLVSLDASAMPWFSNPIASDGHCAKWLSQLGLQTLVETKEDIPSSDQPVVPFPTVTELVTKESTPLPIALAGYSIPKKFLPFYDPKTGVFHYQRTDPPISLLEENGDAPVKLIRINYPQSRKEKEERKIFGALLSDYLRVLSQVPDLRLLILAHEDHQIEEALNHANVSDDIRSRILIFSDEYSPQDQLLRDEPGHFWAQDSAKPLQALDFVVPDSLAEQDPKSNILLKNFLGVEPTHSNLLWHGGDIIVGARHVFVGRTSIAKTMHRFKISHKEAISAFEEEFGKPVFAVSDETWRTGIDYHIDLHMSVVRDQQTGEEVVVIRSPQDWLRQKYGPGYRLSQIVISKEIKMKELERRLVDLGYRVRRVPGLTFDSSLNSLFFRSHALVSPSSDPEVNAEYEAFIRSLGYKVIWMPSAQLLFKWRGGARCASFMCNGAELP